MKRYAFRLEAVLRARRAAESVAQANLLRANASVLAAEAAADRSSAHYREVQTLPGLGFMVHRERATLAARALIGARESLSEARATREAAMLSYLGSARAVSVLERLDRRRREEHAMAARREDILVVDEIVTNRHRGKGRS